mmetsp:Transcript_53001/g.105290  ORF Transcript_53001/g.105290 Transcript_53001/m.105290 type:complete len:104 (-) Transcript_53001:36-347(-)
MQGSEGGKGGKVSNEEGVSGPVISAGWDITEAGIGRGINLIGSLVGDCGEDGGDGTAKEVLLAGLTGKAKLAEDVEASSEAGDESSWATRISPLPLLVAPKCK